MQKDSVILHYWEFLLNTNLKMDVSFFFFFFFFFFAAEELALLESFCFSSSKENEKIQQRPLHYERLLLYIFS